MGNNNSKTVFSQCLEWLEIPPIISDFLDYRSPKLTIGATVRLFVEACLSGRKDTESIAINLKASPELQELTGVESISHSQLTRKLGQFPVWLSQYLFDRILGDLGNLLEETCTRKVPELPVGPLTLVDSSGIKLPGYSGKWAYVNKDKNQVKLHLSLSTEWPDIAVPRKVVLSTGAVSDTEVAFELVTDRGTTYVMDRGYIHYAHFKAWLEAGISFVARIQKRSKTQVLEERPIPEGEPDLLRDADVQMEVPKDRTQKMRLRLVEFKDSKDRTYRVVTTRWDLTAREVAECYRARWGIELFFKWMKQYLKLSKLYSAKPEAVWNHIYLCLISHALCALVKLKSGTGHGLCKVLKYMRQYMAKGWEEMLAELNRSPSKFSRGRQKKPIRGRPRKHPKKYKAQKQILADASSQ